MKKKGVFSKTLVTFVVVMNIVFTGVVLWIFSKTAQEPVVLIGAWFGFTTGELWMVAKIKRDKIKGNKEEEQNDKDRLEGETEQQEAVDADPNSGD